MKGKTEKGQLCVFDPSSRPPWYGATNAQWYTHPHLISAVLIPPHKSQKFKIPPTQRNPRPNKY